MSNRDVLSALALMFSVIVLGTIIPKTLFVIAVGLYVFKRMFNLKLAIKLISLMLSVLLATFYVALTLDSFEVKFSIFSMLFLAIGANTIKELIKNY